jgi:hypothetical protein
MPMQRTQVKQIVILQSGLPPSNRAPKIDRRRRENRPKTAYTEAREQLRDLGGSKYLQRCRDLAALPAEYLAQALAEQRAEGRNVDIIRRVKSNFFLDGLIEGMRKAEQEEEGCLEAYLDWWFVSRCPKFIVPQFGK